MQVRVINDLSDLAGDIARIPVKAAAELPAVVEQNIENGNLIAQRFARQYAGPHGANYYKRLSAEMTGPLTGEFGPTGTPKTNFVGVGFRHGRNADLPKAADIVAPRFADDVGDTAEGWFW